VPLTVLESPYREVTRPIIGYIRSLRENRPRDIVSVFIPEYVVGRWWEQLLHNQTALRLKGRLLFQPGVMVTSVPWQLDSSSAARERMLSRPDGPAAPARHKVRTGGGGGKGGGGAGRAEPDATDTTPDADPGAAPAKPAGPRAGKASGTAAGTGSRARQSPRRG
jgi:hypothetical protein